VATAALRAAAAQGIDRANQVMAILRLSAALIAASPIALRASTLMRVFLEARRAIL
jgi:hypothetical protein